ncbi:hypothetical protein L917_17729 [Phytophthora nicotianae]|uniref:SWIM-type domain-containing protein n=1 Tax=Phytophthora nicotianae TaxID=4792 RepID=W2K9X9_PHYNI|nr:hypothetical protein L917_17729 [Phytophthora nicotianae]
MVLFKVHQALLETDNLELIAKIMRVSSVNDVRVHTVGMPDEGSFADVQELTCGCLYNAKNGMCLHVLAAGFEAGVCIPGTAAHPRRFVANIQRCRRGPLLLAMLGEQIMQPLLKILLPAVMLIGATIPRVA